MHVTSPILGVLQKVQILNTSTTLALYIKINRFDPYPNASKRRRAFFGYPPPQVRLSISIFIYQYEYKNLQEGAT